MTKNGIFLSVVAVILAAIYVTYFTDWFHKETIQIFPTIRPSQASSIPRDPGMPPVYPVSFAFNGKYRLTEVKVLVEEDMKTNKYPTPVWHMISEKGSPPMKSLIYGFRVKNMKPAIPRSRPQPLLPDVKYVLEVAAGDAKGQTNFFTRAAVGVGARR